MANDNSQESEPHFQSRPQPQSSIKPWYHHLTLDLFTHVLSRSVFHPAIVLIFWLCLCGMHKHRSPTAFYTLYYASFLAVIDILMWINHRIAYGKPRKVEWEKEVVIITGGGSGLGRVIVESFVRRGVKVGVLDVCERDEGVEELVEGFDLVWERCDVGKIEDVDKAVGRIAEELGTPTILINNAAAPINALPLLPAWSTTPSPASPTYVPYQGISTLTPQQATQALQTNTLSHFNLLSAVLPHLTTSAMHANGATIITISSILSHLHPAYLADYTASKSAVSALHQSLTHEIAAHSNPDIRLKIKTLLVETGQIDTALFEGVKLPWYAHFFGPVLDSKDVAREIIGIVGRGEGGVLRMPFYAKIVGGPLWAMIPRGVMGLVRWGTGIDGAMSGVGRGNGRDGEGEEKVEVEVYSGNASERKKSRS